MCLPESMRRWRNIRGSMATGWVSRARATADSSPTGSSRRRRASRRRFRRPASRTSSRRTTSPTTTTTSRWSSARSRTSRGLSIFCGSGRRFATPSKVKTPTLFIHGENDNDVPDRRGGAVLHRAQGRRRRDDDAALSEGRPRPARNQAHRRRAGAVDRVVPETLSLEARPLPPSRERCCGLRTAVALAEAGRGLVESRSLCSRSWARSLRDLVGAQRCCAWARPLRGSWAAACVAGRRWSILHRTRGSCGFRLLERRKPQ